MGLPEHTMEEYWPKPGEYIEPESEASEQLKVSRMILKVLTDIEIILKRHVN